MERSDFGRCGHLPRRWNYRKILPPITEHTPTAWEKAEVRPPIKYVGLHHLNLVALALMTAVCHNRGPTGFCNESEEISLGVLDLNGIVGVAGKIALLLQHPRQHLKNCTYRQRRPAL